MFEYFSNTGQFTTAATDPEIMRDLVELSLIEEYHWTPHYIRALPYKWIQKHMLMKKMKRHAQDNRAQQDKIAQESRVLKPGEKKTREV